jgi:integral membrane protein (TIGR01906 family)
MVWDLWRAPLADMTASASPSRAAWRLGLALAFQVTLPLVLSLTAVRLTMTHAYVELAYRIPGFPPDPYGFTLEDRLRWSIPSLDYLLNSASINFLGDLHFDNGTPIYNDRELRHMADVKNLAIKVLALWEVALAAWLIFGVALGRVGGQIAVWRSIRVGAIWTLMLMAGLALTLLVSFSFVFVGFHHLFFQGDTWLFLYSDTLIRLFPERFWEQVFAFITLVTVAGAGGLWWLASARLRSAEPVAS